MIPPTILIEDTDFASAWARAVRSVLRQGVPLTIGDVSEPKPILDVCATISLTGNAIKQIENREIHPQYPFVHIDQYCEEFTPDFQEKYLNAEDDTMRFVYTYYDRITNHKTSYGCMNQLWYMYEELFKQVESVISSNRSQAITWVPGKDVVNPASPCLQRVWVRYLGYDDVEVHFDWRSRDLFTAWQSNIIALVNMLNREVVHPNNCKIVKLVDHSSSLHIYCSDKISAAQVKLVPVNPCGGKRC